MKKHLLFLPLFLSFSSLVHAQWTASGNNTYYNLSGNVGIGIINPTNKLDVGGVINTSSYITSTLGFYVPNTSNGINNTLGGNSLSFRTGNVDNRMVIDGNGNVGIGTTNPVARLTLAGSGNLNPNPGPETDYNGLGIAFKGESNGGSFVLGGIKMVQPQGVYLDAADMVLSTSMQTNSERMRITSVGNVGIGTTNPSEKLTINGNVRIMSLYDNNGLFAYDASTGGNSIFSFSRQANNLSMAAWDGIGFSVSARTGASTNYSMFINPAGNVSIGTLDPKGYKLAVNGSAIATSMTVKLNSAWPDYVFKKDYQLPSLQEVKAYIDQNQHLPEIPSEQQIAKDGLNLGEMNKLLMKKVEELTLYLIEQKEENEKMKSYQENMNKKQQEQINQLAQQLKGLTNAPNKN